MYSLVIAALANCHKHSGLKQHKLLSQFWGQQSKMKVTGYKQDISRTAYFSGGFRRKYVFLPFPVYRGWPQSYIYVFLSSKPAVGIQAFLTHLALTLTFLPPFSTLKDPCDFILPTQIIQDNFLILKSVD